jgi:hypothetical protein
MPRELIFIDQFGGINNQNDPQDIGDNEAASSRNIDGSGENGYLQGINNFGTAKYFSDANAKSGVLFQNPEGNYDIVLYGEGRTTTGYYIQCWKNFYGTLTGIISNSIHASLSTLPKCFNVLNRGVFIGIGAPEPSNANAAYPMWMGYVNKQFGGTVPASPVYAAAKCNRPDWAVMTYSSGNYANTNGGHYVLGLNVSTHSTVSSDPFQTGNYFYDITLVYNNVEESLIGDHQDRLYQVYGLVDTPDLGYIRSGFGIGGGVSAEKITVKISILNPTAIDKRITAIKVYRCTTSIISGTVEKRNEYMRLVKTIDINDASWDDDVVGGSGGSISYKYFTFDDLGAEGNTYENITSMPETLSPTDLAYGLSCEVNNCLVVGLCRHSKFPDARRMLFKSKPYAFATFDWTNEVIMLKEQPTALASYNGYIYAFTSHGLYRINGQSFVIEDYFEGAGCYNERCVDVSEYGMFWMGHSGKYLMNEQGIKRIDDKCKEIREVPSLAPAYDGHVAFDNKKKYALFSSYDDNGYVTLAYQIEKDRWDYWVFGTKQSFAYIKGVRGELYKTFPMEELYKGSRMDYSWVSKKFTLGEPDQKKKFYMLSSDYTSGISSSAIVKSLIYIGSSIIEKALSSVGVVIGHSFQISITMPGTKTVYNACQTFRRMIGKR